MATARGFLTWLSAQDHRAGPIQRLVQLVADEQTRLHDDGDHVLETVSTRLRSTRCSTQATEPVED
jgi:hypothetical protein